MKHIKPSLNNVIYTAVFLCVVFSMIITNPLSAEMIPGNRRIDWSQAGVPGGIPGRTTPCVTAQCNTLYRGDVSSATISAAIVSAPDNSVIRIPAGTYNLDAMIEIKRSNLVLRGAGMGLTILRPSHNNTAIAIYGWSFINESRPISGGSTKGSTSFTASDISGMSAGDTLNIWEDNESFMWSRWGKTRLLRQSVMIENVDAATNTVTFSPPLVYSFTNNPAYARSAAIYYPGSLRKNIGIEDLTIDGVNSSDVWTEIWFGAVYSWIKNIEIKNFGNAGITLIDALKDTVHGCYIHDTYFFNEGYGITLYHNSTANLVENNIFHHLWLGVGGGGNVSGDTGNVIAYNYVTGNSISLSFIETAYPYANLRMGTVKTNIAHNAFVYYACWQRYAQNANTAGVPLSGAAVPQNKYGAWALNIDAAGEIHIVEAPNNSEGYNTAQEAASALPQINFRLYIKVGHVTAVSVNADGFIPGSTALDAAGVTVSYSSMQAYFPYQIPGFIEQHGPHSMMNLWEGNVASQFQNDGYHGSGSHATLFRNHFHGLPPFPGRTGNRKMIDLCRFSRYHNVVGNILGDASWTADEYEMTGVRPYSHSVIYRLGYPNMGNNVFSTTNPPTNGDEGGLDPEVRETLLRHGNYDYLSKTTVWDSEIADRSLPSSLYLSEKPSWWGNQPWPPIGPDVAGMANKIPAQLRYEQISGMADTTPPAAPAGLTVN